MKTDYTTELQNLIKNLFIPSTPEDAEAIPMALSELYTQVTNILPEKWIDEADLYNCLENNGFKCFNQVIENETTKQKTYVLKYFLKTI